METADNTPGLASQPPRSDARATRIAGRRMRSRLLDGASALFKERGLSGTTIADIAVAADAFPSQITYYFHSKEALFVEAACRDVLYVARDAEIAAAKTTTPEDYTRALVGSVMGADALPFFVEALTLSRRRPDLVPLIERTMQRLHAEGFRAYAAEMAKRGWRGGTDPATTARRFWALALGVAVEGHAMGRTAEDLSAELMLHFGSPAGAAAPGKHLRIAGGTQPANRSTPDTENAP